MLRGGGDSGQARGEIVCLHPRPFSPTYFWRRVPVTAAKERSGNTVGRQRRIFSCTRIGNQRTAWLKGSPRTQTVRDGSSTPFWLKNCKVRRLRKRSPPHFPTASSSQNTKPYSTSRPVAKRGQRDFRKTEQMGYSRWHK